MYFIPQSESLERLNNWLLYHQLPDLARECLENFVMSCDNPDSDDISNFIDLDIVTFPISVQETMVTGFFYAYSGQGDVSYLYDRGAFILMLNN